MAHMADEQPPKMFINGIDLSAYVKDFRTDTGEFDGRAFGESFPGLKRMEPISITGHWIDYGVTCGNCGQPFVPGPEGTPVLTDTASGLSIEVCPDCVVAVLGLNQE